MIKGDYEKLDNLAKFNLCAEHHTPLEVAWYGKDKTWVLRCGEDHYPEALVRQLSLTQEYKAGEPVPEIIVDKIKKGQRRRSMQNNSQSSALQIGAIPPADLGTGQSLQPSQVQALLDYARKYDLDAYRGHVVMMYGEPYIGIDGYLYHANKSGRPYSLRSRPMTAVELKQYKIEPADHAWIAELTFTDTMAAFTGLGIVTCVEMTAKSPRDETKLRSPVVANHPQLLAQKRAEWQVLRRGFPIGGGEE